ncbi:hypothetical protein GCM10010525_04840 [Glutamicibacter bergerei]
MSFGASTLDQCIDQECHRNECSKDNKADHDSSLVTIWLTGSSVDFNVCSF